MNYSVLMSVYSKETPQNLRDSMNSILHQTVKTDDLVLVCDGPLGEELDAVLDEMKAVFGDSLHIIRLPRNGGLGPALNLGMKACRHELVARMDSDDISYPDRCERQLAVFSRFPGIDICSGAVEEFVLSPEKIECVRELPEVHEEIYEFAKTRCPFNHPCIMYKKQAVAAAGGYLPFVLEDYYLWVRMLLNGAKGYNIQEPLLWMRAGREMYKRRSGWKYAKGSCELFCFMKNMKMISTFSCIRSCLIRTGSALAPNFLREFMYEKMLRKSGDIYIDHSRRGM